MSTYKIVEELGRGGMGVVYRALHPALNREVAIKFLQGSASDVTSVGMSRFRREMDVLMRLSHPSIVKVYDAGETDGRLFYVMELLRARDLYWHMKRRGRLSVAVVAAVLDQLLDALDYLHQGGVLHRDIKPSNIVLEDSGRAILMDFGVVYQQGATLLTAEGHAVGTPRYFSPEMIQRGESSPASDQFSLGVVAYELLTCFPPFEGDTLAEVANAIIRVDPKPLLERRPEVPPGVAAVIHRMMEKDPAARWPSAAAAAEALQEALVTWGEAPSTLLESSLVPLPPAPPASRPTRKRSVAVEPRMLVTGAGIPAGAAARSGGAAALDAPIRNFGALLAAGGAAFVVLVAAIVYLALPPRQQAATAPLRASEVSVRRTAPDRVQLSFHTAAPSRWAVDRGRGAEGMEAKEGTDHAIELTTSPWQPDDALVLISGPQRVELEPPVSLADLIHRLSAAVRERGFSAQAMDKLWVSIRSDLVRLSSRVTAKTFREVLPKSPGTRKRFEDYAADLKRTRGVAQTLEALGPHVAAILASGDTPVALRHELLNALWSIDRFDGLASWLALPSAFGVQRMLAPALEVATDLTDELPPEEAPRLTLPLAPDERGVVMVIPTEIPAGTGNSLLDVRDTLFVMRQATHGRATVHEGTFSNAGSPEAEARRFRMQVEALDPNVYIELKPPGFDTPLPIRLPDTMAPGASENFWITVTLRGALGRPRGLWKMRQSRAFEEMSRLYVIVDRVLEEPVAK